MAIKYFFINKRQAVVVIDEDGTEVIQVPLAEREELVEAFLLDRLDEPLDEGDGVGRTEGRLLHPQSGGPAARRQRLH